MCCICFTLTTKIRIFVATFVVTFVVTATAIYNSEGANFHLHNFCLETFHGAIIEIENNKLSLQSDRFKRKKKCVNGNSALLDSLSLHSLSPSPRVQIKGKNAWERGCSLLRCVQGYNAKLASHKCGQNQNKNGCLADRVQTNYCLYS